MGECLIMRRGGETRKVPILDPNYPQDVSVIAVGDNAESVTFTVVISEPGNPAEYTYQWYVNDTPITDATSATYTMTDLLEAAFYSVYCEVRNKAGVVNTRVATLNVAHLNGSYPADATISISSSVTSNVVLETNGNTDSYTYQWYVNGNAVSGATNSTYTFTPSLGTTTLYCKVTNSAGSVDSRTATITASAIYLIKSGSDQNSITGGWGTKAIPDVGPGWGHVGKSPTITTNSGYIAFTEPKYTASAYGGVAYAKKTVNLTGISKIIIKASGWYSSGDDYCTAAISVWKAFGENFSQNRVANVVITSLKEYSLDVSKLTGSLYIGVSLQNSMDNKSAYVNIYDLRLE